jgi:hypothetical protein
VVRNDITVFGKILVADCAFATLLGDLSVQQLPHLGWRPKFSVSSSVMRIIDALHAKS